MYFFNIKHNKTDIINVYVKKTKKNKLKGYYKTGQTYSTEENQCDVVTNSLHGITIEILFNTDGTYTSAYASDCGGGYKWSGTHLLNDNKLTLICNNENSTCIGGNYKIENIVI